MLQKLDQIGRNLAPVAVTLLLILFGLVPLQLPGWDKVTPGFSLMAVYYWTVHRPDLFRPSVAFGIGLLEDVFSGGPMGLQALTLVATHWLVSNQRIFFLANPFAMMWSGFTLIVLLTSLLRWLICSIYYVSLFPIGATLFQGLLTLALYPLVAWLFVRVHRSFLHGT